MASRWYLGVDGGGTHTRALLADQDGRVLGAGRSGSTNRNHHPRDAVRSNVRSALLGALGERKADASLTIFLGMCAVSTDRDRADIVSIVREIPEIGASATVIVENDARIGLTGGLSGRPGIVLIAGTGSACLGVSAEGKSWWCGGWGALADDAGSAPWIGLRALQAAVRDEDGRAPQTALRDIVFSFLELSEPRELIDRVHNRGLTREELGDLAPRVIGAFRDGDAMAAGILTDATAELSQLVSTTAARLFSGSACELILVGGLALSGPPFQDLLVDRILRDAPNVRVREPELSPVQGAVLEAMRSDGKPWNEDVIRRLSEDRA
ncbi:MAG TPA: BadF/BadG/BcrA/BcrD ATPase family protein [Tepidisphaeraceae bacterium]|jgi:N-acetylglucosamine kinase-like BadF-type ATPase